MVKSSLADLSVEALVEAQQKNSQERAAYEEQFKARGHEIQSEIDKRITEERFKAQLEGLDPEVQRAIVAGIERDLKSQEG